MRHISYTIPDAHDGLTVGVVLRRGLDMSGRAVRHAKYVEQGILLDGVRVRTNVVVRAGQTLEIEVADDDASIAGSQVEAQDGPVDIVFEDDDLLVVNKPAGLVMYPCPGHGLDTLGNYLMGYFKASGKHCNLHPVQRLDRGTSGLLVFTTNGHAHDVLQRSLHSGDFSRGYLAICAGMPQPTEGVVDAPIMRDPAAPRQRFCVAQGELAGAPDAKPARSHYRVLASSPDGSASLVLLELETGRTHQIRIHMAHIGCPLLGDVVYGAAAGGDAGIERPALHSAHIELTHPIGHEHLRFTQPLPPDMQRLAESLGLPPKHEGGAWRLC